MALARETSKLLRLVTAGQAWWIETRGLCAADWRRAWRPPPVAPSAAAACRPFHSSAGERAFRTAGAQSTLPLRTGRPRLVVLGTGWGAARLVSEPRSGASHLLTLLGLGWERHASWGALTYWLPRLCR